MLAPAPGRHAIAQKHEFARFSRTATNLRQYRLLPKCLATRSWYRRGYLAILTSHVKLLQIRDPSMAGLRRWPLKAKVIPVGIADVQLLHAVVRDLGLLHSNAARTEVSVRRIHVRAT